MVSFQGSIRSKRRPHAPGERSAGCTAIRNRAPAPAPPPLCPPPEGDAGWRRSPQLRRGNAGGRRRRLHWRRLCAHPDLLSLLKELAFVLDRRRDHELGLLELAQRARAADPHGGAKGADEVL